MSREQRQINIKASQHNSFTALTILALLLPLIGIVIGIVYLTRSKPIERKLGEHLIAISILMMLIVGTGYVVLNIISKSNNTASPSVSIPAETTPTPTKSTWNVDTEYAKISNGMTRQAVENAIAMKPSQDCIQQNVDASTKYSSCTYGDVSQGSAIIVTYQNGVVTQKQDIKY